jgi:mannose-1-phosphate guanylyltransferase/mannose-6-phosphate isomerase
LSREAFPKQFHSIGTSKTLFQETCIRLLGAPFGTLTILANRKHRFLVADQLDAIGIEQARIVLEREARNTAPVACVAALMACGRTGIGAARCSHRIIDRGRRRLQGGHRQRH